MLQKETSILKQPKLMTPVLIFSALKFLSRRNRKDCSDPLFLEFVDWIRSEDRGLYKDAQRKRFERSFRNYMLDQQIQRANIAAGLIWDTSRDNIFAPSRTEMALSLPEYSKLRNQVYKSIQTEEFL